MISTPTAAISNKTGMTPAGAANEDKTPPMSLCRP